MPAEARDTRVTQARLWRATRAVLLLLALIELAIRALGVVDFPLYDLDASFGYAPRPTQSGTLLRRNRWVFNDHSMGVDAPWRPGDRIDLLLVGNSIVMGGNPYDQRDKLAPLLQSALSETTCTVWPVAAGGWSTLNEIGFLERHPDLIQGADYVVWELMPGQMSSVTPWGGETLQPTHAPRWATGYLALKAWRQQFRAQAPLPLVTSDQLSANFERLNQTLSQVSRLGSSESRGVLFLYPDREQLVAARAGHEWVPERSRIERLAQAHSMRLLDVARDPSWTDRLYRDNVHPTPEGNAVLAKMLARVLVERGNRAPLCPLGP